jgi:hypothetical protein
MSCKEYEQMESMQKQERSKWADFSYREKENLPSGVDYQTAKELAEQARARAVRIGKEMYWHQEYCQECKAPS